MNMTMVSFGDLAQSFLTKAQSGRLKAESLRITQELSSGQRADVGAAVSGDHTRLAAISHSHRMAEGYLSVAAEAGFRTASLQTVLSQLTEEAQTVVSDLALSAQDGSDLTLGMASGRALQTLDAMMAKLNTAPGGRSLLGGTAVTGPAVAGATALLDALRPVISAATSPDEAMVLARDWFDDPAGFQATIYLGGAALPDLAISENEKVWLGVTARDDAFREVLAGVAMAALAEETPTALSPPDRRRLATLASDQTRTGIDRITELAGRVRQSQSRIEATQTRLQSERLVLEIARSDIVGSDPLKLATELEAVQTNLETLYAVTARLSRLNLADFLR
jgi:flagellar hook-associated protein 3 FlgL